jgi:DNA-binding GntR family transcriptional regulator
VYLHVLGRIQRREVAAGDRIVDTALATEFGLSRMPVRQALLRLVHEGYLVGTTRGFVLPHLSRRDSEEIFEVRMLIEPRAAAAAAQAIGAAQVDALADAYQEACEAVTERQHDRVMRANDRFRRIWLEAVPNQRLAGTIARFVDHVQIVRSATMADAETQVLVLNLLERLLAGFRGRDALAVFDTTLLFVSRAREIYLALGPAEERAELAG